VDLFPSRYETRAINPKLERWRYNRGFIPPQAHPPDEKEKSYRYIQDTQAKCTQRVSPRGRLLQWWPFPGTAPDTTARLLKARRKLAPTLRRAPADKSYAYNPIPFSDPLPPPNPNTSEPEPEPFQDPLPPSNPDIPEPEPEYNL
jgi:hypothetical protein